ncbi:MAG TPA: hypothetical protein VGK49_11255 [Ilumatobacteraceae bacterium]
MITTGVVGRHWRASVTGWGSVLPWDGSPELDWWVAADDRWHTPSHEPALRQARIDGTAVVETRLRVPRGDAVHRVYSVADAGGLTIVEVTNESTLPIAIAFGRSDVRTERPIVDVPIEGITLPAGSFVVPVGHLATARVALAHDGSGAGPIPAGVAGHEQVVRGWAATVERASRLDLPPGGVLGASVAAVSAQRCEVMLGGLGDPAADPAAFALGLGELARMGEPADPFLPELAEAVSSVARHDGWRADVALAAAQRVLAASGERRAVRDLERITRSRVTAPSPPEAPDDVFVVPWLERRLALDGVLLPEGLPREWLGASFEVHGVPVGCASTVSYAVRWHGERPAVLWEVTGDPAELTAPAIDPTWRTSAPSGEALWPAPDTTFS